MTVGKNMTTSFNFIEIGDALRLADGVEKVNLAPGLSFKSAGRNRRDVVVTDVTKNDAGLVVSIEVEGQDGVTVISADDDVDIEFLSYANILPDSDYITWAYDHVQHLAMRTGHPANNVWLYNGKQYSAADLRDIIGDARIHTLVLRDQ